ncbi:multidrug resistance efflux transporter family protein [Bacillus paranthracis]
MDRVGFCCWYWFLFFIKFCSCLFSSLARCWNLASYYISRFTTSPLFFVKIETKSGTKLVRGKIPLRSLYVALFILLGVICMQATAAGHITITQFISGFLPVVLAAFLYPFGNRKNDGTCWWAP